MPNKHRKKIVIDLIQKQSSINTEQIKHIKHLMDINPNYKRLLKNEMYSILATHFINLLQIWKNIEMKTQ